MSAPTAELRRHPRVRASWRVAVDIQGGKAITRETIDISPYGVKVRLDEGLGLGTTARLRLQPPDRRPLILESTVWRADSDGSVFVFVNISGDDLQRLKALVDDHRGA
jgi:hypothetical protein